MRRSEFPGSWPMAVSLVVSVFASGCLELPSRYFQCDPDAGCAKQTELAGEPYVCSAKNYCIPAAGIPGLDGGRDGGTGSDGGGSIYGPPRRCPTDGGWCYENPVAGEGTLYAVHGRAENDFWVAGAQGAALHWDGTRWDQLETGTTETLYSVWAAGDGGAWFAGGNGTLLHQAGPNLSAVSQTLTQHVVLRGVSGAGPSVFAAGANGTVLAFDGGQWTQVSTPTDGGSAQFNAIWAATPTEAWAVGAGGLVAHVTNGAWTGVPDSGTPADLTGISGTSPDAGLAVGKGQTRVQWDGGAWSASAGANPAEDFTSVWAFTDGKARISSSAGTMYRFEPSPPALYAEATPSPNGNYGVWGPRSDSAWAVGQGGQILHGSGSSWVDFAGGSVQRVIGLWGPGNGSLWGVGDVITLQRQNGVWTPQPTPTPGLARIWGTSEGIWAVGNSGIYRWSDNQWTQERAGSFRDISGNSTGTLWAVGAGGTVASRPPGGPWSQVTSVTTSSPPDFTGVWVGDNGDVWAVGAASAVWQNRGGSWGKDTSSTQLGTNNSYTAVWGTGPDDVWLMGGNGIIGHYTSTGYVPPITGVTGNIRHIAGSSTGAWAVGDQGMVLRRSGNNWVYELGGTSGPTLTSQNLYGVWVDDTGVWAAGEKGVVIHRAR